tara:strand:+ start:424 stop:672 length:249 start_codon:yes stop_codon:yes gene_type:complete
LRVSAPSLLPLAEAILMRSHRCTEIRESRYVYERDVKKEVDRYETKLIANWQVDPETKTKEISKRSSLKEQEGIGKQHKPAR